MCKKLIILTCVLLVSLASNALAATWDNSSGDGLWRTPANWAGNVVPGGGVSVISDIVPGPTIDSLTAAVCTNMLIGLNGSSTLDMIGGSLNNAGYWSIGHNPNINGTITVSGGATVSNVGTVYVGNHGSGSLSVSGSSTTMDASGLLTLCTGSGSTSSHVNLYSGTLSCEDLDTYGGATTTKDVVIDIEEGTLIVRNKAVGTMQDWIDNDLIVGYSGTGTVILTIDGNGYEVLTAIPEPATIALLGMGGLALIRRKRA